MRRLSLHFVKKSGAKCPTLDRHTFNDSIVAFILLHKDRKLLFGKKIYYFLFANKHSIWAIA